MIIDSLCPYCHNLCAWSTTSDTKYVRCSHCERMFVASTWGGGDKFPAPGHRRKKRPPPLWPWCLFTVFILAVVVGGSQLYNAKRAARDEPKVTREHFERLSVGMRARDVIKLLGNPSRIDESVLPRVDFHMSHRYEVDKERFLKRYFWEEDDNMVWVDFVQGHIQRFGAVFDGERIGEEVNRPIIEETRNTDNP